MSSRNLVILLGHLGRDPETRYTPQGLAVCTLAVATSQKWKDKQTGELKEETEWSRVVLYERKAEVAQQNLKKGSQVYIEGRLKTKKWTDKNGIERYTTEVIADLLQMMGSKPATGQGNANLSQTPTAVTPNTPAPAPERAASFSDIADEEIPF